MIDSISGSHLYGTHTHTSDEDSMGIFVNPMVDHFGWNRPTNQQKVAGKEDQVMYELTEWVRLASHGNPTVLQMLWVPRSHWIQWIPEWETIQQELNDLVLSQRVRHCYLGYMQGQRIKLTKDKGQRKELVEKYGYDTKFAMHLIRLGLQGVELLRHGSVALPMLQVDRQYMLEIREGSHTLDEILDHADALEQELRRVPTDLPLEPPYEKIHQWLARTYLKLWGVQHG